MKNALIIILFVCTCSVLESGSHTKSYQKYEKFILKAEASASTPARNVMQTVRRMVQNRVVIKGACWDYLDRAFAKAGYPRGKRAIIHRGTKSGPYAKASQIREGDWLYYINHSYGDIEHSGMFIGWTDRSKRLGLIMSYAGEGRAEPARYRVYDLRHVYQIMRAK